MARFLTLLVVSIAVALPLSAQDSPKLEVFGGYQYLHAGNFDGAGDSVNTNGWNASATFNFAKHLGIAADFSGNYKTEQSRRLDCRRAHLYLRFRTCCFRECQREV